MIKRFVVYRLSDGLVVRAGFCQEQDLEAQAQDGEASDSEMSEDVVADGTWYFLNDAYQIAAPPIEMVRAQKELALQMVASSKMSLWMGDTAPAGGLQVDDASMGRMAPWNTQALASKLAGSPFGLAYWIMADNTHRAIDGPDDFLAFAQAASVYKTDAVQNNATLKAAIRSAQTAAEIEAIDIQSGWP